MNRVLPYQPTRPVDIVESPDDTIVISDDYNGVIWLLLHGVKARVLRLFAAGGGRVLLHRIDPICSSESPSAAGSVSDAVASGAFRRARGQRR
jgi:hypothetical protein